LYTACRLAPDLTSISTARRYAESIFANESVAGFDIVALLITEVVTNAVVHARTPIVMTVRATGETIRVEVHDDDSTLPVVQRAEPYQPGGRGMAIVDALAADWGVVSEPFQGKTVWFEMAWSPHTPEIETD